MSDLKILFRVKLRCNLINCSQRYKNLSILLTNSDGISDESACLVPFFYVEELTSLLRPRSSITTGNDDDASHSSRDMFCMQTKRRRQR